MHRADADLQATRSFIDTERLAARCLSIELSDAKAFPELAHSHRRPGFTIGGLAAHSVHRHSELPVRPSTAKFPHNLDRCGMPILGVSTVLGAGDAKLGMSATRPMHSDDGFVRRLVEVDHDFLDQESCQALLRPGVGCDAVPDVRQIVRERE